LGPRADSAPARGSYNPRKKGELSMQNLVADVVAPAQQLRAEQQPRWDDPSQVQRVREILAARPPLVRLEEVRALRALLARVAAGQAHVVQAGDCAEDPDDCTAEHVSRKCAVLDLLAGSLKMITHTPGK
jgi:3-deoxy-7-phosphoheptulonate synthase